MYNQSNQSPSIPPTSLLRYIMTDHLGNPSGVDFRSFVSLFACFFQAAWKKWYNSPKSPKKKENQVREELNVILPILKPQPLSLA